MAVAITIRNAAETDFAAVARLDLTYATERFLRIERSGAPPELTTTFRWQRSEPAQAVYDDLSEDGLERAIGRTDLFIIAQVDEAPAGYLMVLLPSWTDAGEITDLAVHRPLRRRGVGQALVGEAADWARDRSLRALWAEPRADNAAAIEFYLSLGFRLSGFSDRLHSNRDNEDGRPTIFMHLELV